jgi:hypothetical protein
VNTGDSQSQRKDRERERGNKSHSPFPLGVLFYKVRSSNHTMTEPTVNTKDKVCIWCLWLLTKKTHVPLKEPVKQQQWYNLDISIFMYMRYAIVHPETSIYRDTSRPYRCLLRYLRARK